MFGETENVLRTLKNPSSVKGTPIAENKSQYISLFEAIDRETVKVTEAQLFDPTKDDLETQQKKLTEMSVDGSPEDAEEKEGYTYFGSSAQENFYYKADFDPEAKKLISIQVINSVDEEVANVQNSNDEKTAKLINDIVDQLKLDSVSFKMLQDVAAIDIEPDVITPADGGEGGGAGGPGAPDTGAGGPITGAEEDSALGDQGLSGDATGASDNGGGDAGPAGEEEDDETKKFLVGSKESITAIPVLWAKTVKETSNLFESKEKAVAAKTRLPQGNYQIIERGKKVSLVARILGENIVSSKTRYLVANEALDVQITPSGVSIKIDDGGASAPAAAPVAASTATPVTPIDQGSVEPIEILTDDMPEVGEDPDFKEGDEVEFPDTKESKLHGKFKVVEKTTKGYKLLKVSEKQLKETKQIIKGWSESTSAWVTDPTALRQLLEAPNPSNETVVVFVENGRNGSELLSNMQGESVDVGQVIVKIPVSGAAAPQQDSSLPPPPITPAEAAAGQMPEAKQLIDVTKKTGQELINDLLEKHGIKEGETTPASRQDHTGSASISKEGEGNLKMTGGVNLDDKGGPSNSKTSTPASKEDDGGTASISKEGEGKLDTTDPKLKDAGGGPASAASGEAGASADKGPVSNSGAEGSTDGGPAGAADSNTSTSTLESANKNLLEYIAKLEKDMNEEKEQVVKDTIAETITWLKSKIKK